VGETGVLWRLSEFLSGPMEGFWDVLLWRAALGTKCESLVWALLLLHTIRSLPGKGTAFLGEDVEYAAMGGFASNKGSEASSHAPSNVLPG
jgi:hypothetical protein